MFCCADLPSTCPYSAVIKTQNKTVRQSDGGDKPTPRDGRESQLVVSMFENERWISDGPIVALGPVSMVSVLSVWAGTILPAFHWY